MNEYPSLIKQRLNDIIKEMAQSKELFVCNPGKDFTRKRKLPFETIMQLLLSMGGSSLYNELLESDGYNTNTATSSAFVQQREKLLPFAFEFLLHAFNETCENIKKYQGYRLLAVDGTDLNIAHNPKDTDTYFQSNPEIKGFNQLHLNAMFDLCNKLYVDAYIQPGRKENEYSAFVDMIDRSRVSEKTIFIADRGYESYNVFAHVEKKGQYYIVRGKDIFSSGIAASLALPNDEIFDTDISLVLTRKQTSVVKENPDIYKFLPNNSTFDFLDSDMKFFPISFRVVRFKIADDSFETIFTNLNREQFPSNEIKALYFMRWGIETSFRELKYALGLTCFHTKKTEGIAQEIFAKLIMYNFCEMITLNVVIKQKHTKHGYQVNFTVAIRICRFFLRCKANAPPPDVEALIRKNILPVRPGRSNPRKIKAKSTVSFIYRVA